MNNKIIIVNSVSMPKELISSLKNLGEVKVIDKKNNKNNNIKNLFQKTNYMDMINFNEKMNYEAFYHNKLHKWKNK